MPDDIYILPGGGGSGTPTGPAGGDLSGTYPNPTVAKIQTSPVSATAPTTTKQALIWSGTQWVPTEVILVGATAGGDLSGTYPNPTVAALQSLPVSSSAPTTNDALIWNGTTWIHGTVVRPGITAAGGDLSGTYPNPTVVSIQSRGVSASAPSNNQALVWSSGSSLWLPASIVNSWNGRTGAVVPVTNDYTYDQVGALASPTVGLLASRPASPTKIGQGYFATDDAGGTLYESYDGSTWSQPCKRGELASATSTGTQTITSTTAAAVTSMTATATVNARPVRISFTGNVRFNTITAGSAATFQIFRDGAPGTGVLIGEMVIDERVSTANGWVNASFWTRDNPAAGSHSWALYALSPNGSISFVGNASFPLLWMVEEV